MDLEAERLHAARIGDRDALAQLLTTARKNLIQGAVSRRLRPSEWEDGYSETISQIFRSIHNFRGESVAEFEAWLRAIAKNVALNLGRERQRRHAAELSIDLPRLEPSVPPGTSAFESQEWMAWALTQLPPDYAETFMLRVHLNWSEKKVASHLNISQGTVSSRVNRARAALQKLHRGLDRE